MASDVDKLIRKFADDLQTLVRDQLAAEVNAAVQAALGGRQLGKAKAAKPAAKNGGRRTTEEIEKQASTLLTAITKNPDTRSEVLASLVGLSTGELVAPLKKLLGAKQIKASGRARGTTYKAVG